MSSPPASACTAIGDLESLATRHPQVRVPLPRRAGRAVPGGAGGLSSSARRSTTRPAVGADPAAAGHRGQGRAAEPGRDAGRRRARAKGLPVAMIMFEGEGHGFRQAETIKAATEAQLYFLGRILGFEPADECRRSRSTTWTDASSARRPRSRQRSCRRPVVVRWQPARRSPGRRVPSSRRTRWPARSPPTCPSTVRRSGPAGRDHEARACRARIRSKQAPTRLLIIGEHRQGHQPPYPQGAERRELPGERLDLLRRQAELLRLAGGVHLDEHIQAPPGVVQPAVERLGHLDRVQGVELRAKRGHVLGLVGLQVTDDRPAQVRPVGEELGLLRRLLHPVLPEQPDARVVRLARSPRVRGSC